MYKQLQIFSTLILVGFLMAACGSSGGGGSPVVDPPNNQKISTDVHDIYLPKDMTVDNNVSGDFDGAMVFAGSNSVQPKPGPDDQSKLSKSSSGAIKNKAVTGRDVAGFIAQRPALSGETSAADILATINGLLNADPSILSLSGTGTQTFPVPDALIASYELGYNAPIQPTNLANQLVQLLAINTVGGSVSNLPVAITGEPLDSAFTVILGIIFFDSSDVVISVALVPSEHAGTYAHITSNVVNISNVTTKDATIINQTDTFTAEGGGGLSDFLFVVDNSGSMGNEQTAISEAANAFENSILNSGLDFMVGTILTDSMTLRDTSADGGFTNDIPEFKLDVKPGISGSGIETGIWFAEQSLMTSGTVTAEGFPRSGASLSIIILSDERSQYTSRSGGLLFDPLNNLFVTNGYRVYSIITLSQNLSSQYDDLAQATGGTVSSISDPSVFPVIMNNIALDAGGASSRFVLSKTPLASSIRVSLNGTTIVNSLVNGWTFSFSTNTILFHGSAIPAGGTLVSVTYDTVSP